MRPVGSLQVNFSFWIWTHSEYALICSKGKEENLVLIIIVLSHISVITINTDIPAEFATINYPLPRLQSSFSLPEINHITGSYKD